MSEILNSSIKRSIDFSPIIGAVTRITDKSKVAIFPAEKGKDLEIIVSSSTNTGKIVIVGISNAADIGLGRNISIITSNGTPITPIIDSNNKINIPTGTSKFIIESSIFEFSQLTSIKLDLDNPDSGVISVAYSYVDARKFKNIIMGSSSNQYEFNLDRGKKYRFDIHEISRNTNDNLLEKYVTFSYISENNSISKRIITSIPKIYRDGGLVVKSGDSIYVDSYISGTKIKINKSVTNVIFSISEIEDIPIIEQHSNLYTSNISIGDANYYLIDPSKDKSIIVRFDVFSNSGSTIKNSVYMKDKDGNNLAYDWFKLTGTDIENTSFNTNSTGTYYAIANVPTNADRVHVGSTITGTAEVSVNVIGSKEIYNTDKNNIYYLGVSDSTKTIPLKKGRKYKVSIKEVTSSTTSNYAAFKYLTGGSDVTSHIITEDPKIVRPVGLLAVKGNVFYIDCILASASIVITKNTNYLTFSVQEIEDIPKLNTYTNLYTTTSAIGTAFYHTLKPFDKSVLVRLDVTAGTGANIVNSVFFKDKNGVTLTSNNFRLLGSELEGRSFTTNSTNVYYIVANIPANADRVHVGTEPFTGAGEVSVNIISYTDIIENIIKEDQEIIQDSVFENLKLKVSQYKVAQRFIKYNNWEAWIIGSILYISDGTTTKSVNFTTLPNWKEGDYPAIMDFVPYEQGGDYRKKAVRFSMFTVYGNIYHNFPATNSDDTAVVNDFIKFDVSGLYEPTDYNGQLLSSTRFPSKSTSLTADQKKTHRTYLGLPDWNYTQDQGVVGGFDSDGTAYGNGGHPAIIVKDSVTHIRTPQPIDFKTNPQNKTVGGSPVLYSIGGFLSQPFSQKTKLTICAPYGGTPLKRPIVYGTTDGGRTWVVLNEFGVSSSYAGTGANSLNLSSLGAYTAGDLSFSYREYIYPTAEIKDPENAFKYSKAIAVSGVSYSGGKTILTTAQPHGLNGYNCSYITFKAKNAFAWMDNSEVCSADSETQTNGVGNGCFFAAKILSDTTFELLQNWGGADEFINVWHIHSGNPCKDGFVIACGEEYPNGWLCFIRCPQLDDFEQYEIWKHRVGQRLPTSVAYIPSQKNIFRLNSTKNAAQRAVGSTWRDDADQTFIFASDVSYIYRDTVIEGREASKVPKRGSGGLFTAPIKDIDDFSKFKCVLEMEEASLGLVEYADMMAIIGMSYNIYVNVGDINNRQDWVTIPKYCQYAGKDYTSLYFRDLTLGNIIYKIAKK